MRIKVTFDNKRGASLFPEKHFGLIQDLIEKYPNALWRKISNKNGQQGYELEV
ncbi:MAG: hypothetical protein WC533_00640 [Candidatus Pacearchaeota archaeon]